MENPCNGTLGRIGSNEFKISLNLLLTFPNSVSINDSLRFTVIIDRGYQRHAEIRLQFGNNSEIITGVAISLSLNFHRVNSII